MKQEEKEEEVNLSFSNVPRHYLITEVPLHFLLKRFLEVLSFPTELYFPGPVV